MVLTETKGTLESIPLSVYYLFLQQFYGTHGAKASGPPKAGNKGAHFFLGT